MIAIAIAAVCGGIDISVYHRFSCWPVLSRFGLKIWKIKRNYCKTNDAENERS